jgi:hypothetical protein
MTLEQTTEWILRAASAQDLEGLRAAGEERQSAIAALSSVPPTQALRDAVAASIGAGKEARRAIHAIRQQLRKEGRRLANIDRGFLRTQTPAAAHRIDCQG